MQYATTIDMMCGLRWDRLTRHQLAVVARAYYYFSIQFRENLLLAVAARPLDEQLAELAAGECDTDNLSPFPGVALAGERMNHDEFMLRLLALPPFAADGAIDRIGERYLQRVRAESDAARIMSIASYEDGGLERVFTAILDAPDWSGASLAAFRHFLAEHIRFDSDADGGHGALSRHIPVDDRVLPLWRAFFDLMTDCVPSLQAMPTMPAARAVQPAGLEH